MTAMRRLPLAPLFVLTLGPAMGLAGEPAVGVPGSSAAAKPSAETVAKLAAATPRFAPPPQAKAPKPAPDLRETDKPRNTIYRLEPYVVQEKKAPVPPARELWTPKGRLEVALKRHPGARFLNFFGMNDGIALMMLAEEERLERKREFEEMASLTSLTDPEAGAALKREVQRVFLREP